MIAELNRIVGSYGFGRLDMVENRRVGIKSRETYECPGALALLLAHADLEDLTLERDLHHEKLRLEPRWSDSSTTDCGSRRSSRPSTPSSSRPRSTSPARYASASTWDGAGWSGRRSPVSLYDHGLATYDASDTFRHQDAEGFVRLWGLGVATWSAVQEGRGAGRMTLWHGRLDGGTADVVMDYSVSLHFDRRLAPDDLVGSRAHVRGLGRGGLLSEEEVAVLLGRSTPWRPSSTPATFAFVPDDEDIHTAVERRVTELAGDVGAKLHTGRSRNDQIATDLRLYAKRELAALAAEVLGLQDVL